MSDDMEAGAKKAALQHILKSFVPKAKKVKLMSKVKPEVDHSSMYEDDEAMDEDGAPKEDGNQLKREDDDLLERLLAKLGDRGTGVE